MCYGNMHDVLPELYKEGGKEGGREIGVCHLDVLSECEGVRGEGEGRGMMGGETYIQVGHLDVSMFTLHLSPLLTCHTSSFLSSFFSFTPLLASPLPFPSPPLPPSSFPDIYRSTALWELPGVYTTSGTRSFEAIREHSLCSTRMSAVTSLSSR